MANPDPTTKGDYRDVKDVKLWTRDVLIYIAENFPTSREGVIAPDIAKHFGVSKADAAARMIRLKAWHCVTIFIRGKGSTPNIWKITPWGEKCAARWKKKKR